MVSFRGQRWPIRGRIAAGVHSRIGDALEELVHGDPTLLALHATGVEVEGVELGNAAGAVHGQIGFEALLHSLLDTAHDKPSPDGVDAANVDAELDLDPQLARASHEHVHEVGIEAFEGTRSAMEDGYLGAGACRHVSELERDVAPSDEEHACGHAIQLEEAVADAEALGAGKLQGPGHGTGSDDDMAARQAIVADGERGGSHEASQPMELFHAHLRPALLGMLCGPADHRALEAHELGPVDGERPGLDALARQVPRRLNGVRRTDQDLLRHAAAQRTGATERLPIDDGDAPAGLTAPRGHGRGDAGTDDDEIILLVHGVLPFSAAAKLAPARAPPMTHL